MQACAPPQRGGPTPRARPELPTYFLAPGAYCLGRYCGRMTSVLLMVTPRPHMDASRSGRQDDPSPLLGSALSSNLLGVACRREGSSVALRVSKQGVGRELWPRAHGGGRERTPAHASHVTRAAHVTCDIISSRRWESIVVVVQQSQLVQLGR